jgi:hypothetical protein
MRSRATIACLAVVGIVLGGCGSNKAATSPSTPTVATSTGASGPVRNLTYSVRLAGVDGTPSGSGQASISIDSSPLQVCWRFSALEHVPISLSKQRPSFAILQPTPAGVPRTPGVLLGFGFRPSACLPEPSTLLQRLESHPRNYYLSIYNTKTGAVVRGQL